MAVAHLGAVADEHGGGWGWSVELWGWAVPGPRLSVKGALWRGTTHGITIKQPRVSSCMVAMGWWPMREAWMSASSAFSMQREEGWSAMAGFWKEEWAARNAREWSWSTSMDGGAVCLSVLWWAATHTCGLWWMSVLVLGVGGPFFAVVCAFLQIRESYLGGEWNR